MLVPTAIAPDIEVSAVNFSKVRTYTRYLWLVFLSSLVCNHHCTYEWHFCHTSLIVSSKALSRFVKLPFLPATPWDDGRKTLNILDFTVWSHDFLRQGKKLAKLYDQVNF